METTYQVHRQRTAKTPLPPWVRLVREPSRLPGSLIGIGKPADAAAVLSNLTADEEVEVFYVLILNARSEVIATHEVTRGILNSSLVHPREVFRAAIAYAGASLIVGHNHPSGNPEPSPDDRAVTRQLVNAGRIIDLAVIDHVIVGNGGKYFSFAEAGSL